MNASTGHAASRVTRNRKGAFIMRLLTTSALIGLSSLSQANAQTSPSQSASQTSTRAFHIPAQSLSSALNAFGRQSGLQVTLAAATSRGVTSHAVDGQFTPQQALARMLEGTGIPFRINADRTAVIGQAAATAPTGGASVPGAIALDTIDVQGSADGTSGYVATRSSAGTKTDTPLIETPQSVSVVTRKQIEDQAAQSVREALRYTPGVVSEYRGAGGTRYDTIIYRGMGGGVNYDYSYLDGLRLLGVDYAVPQIDIYNLDRVEVLRGPSSVLYGQGTPGGLVNLVSKLPTEESLHEVQLQAGNRGHVQTGFDFGGPLDPDGTLLYRLTGAAHRTDSQVDNQKEERISIAPAFTWKPDADTSLTILGKYQNDPEGGYFGFLPAVGTLQSLPNGGHISRSFFDGSPNFDEFKRTEASIGYQFQHRFDDIWSVESKLRYMHTDLNYKSVYTTGIDTSDPDNPLLKRGVLWNNSHFDAVSADNHAQADFSTGPLTHKFLFGFDYQWLGVNEVQGQGTAPSLSIYNPDYSVAIPTPATTLSSRQRINQLGLYAQDQIKIDKLTLLGGIREDWAQNNQHNRLTSTETDQGDHAFTWRVGAVYEFDSGVAPYVSYSTSFQPAIGTDASGTAFKPTTGQQYEAGIKYQPPGHDSFITAAVYQLTQQNVLVTDPDNTSYSIQTGEIRSRGVELEGHANITDNLELIASYAYMDNINTRSTTAQGYHPTYVPDQTAGLWANYTFHDGAAAGLSIGGGIRYNGRSYANADNSIEVPDFTLFDAAVRYDFGEKNPRLKGLSLAVNATNLFDKEYVSACATATKCFYGLGRTVFGTLTYRW
ncbi:TonB-dependent siderophore receptor [Rhizobium sp. SYY.PMSO]|uniref:TonB-dependent siderophore receptor n=1 Tax=Rhizobium sp. SYY.PMSO TaxID=3382192 RepID=UPI00398FFCF7